MLDIRPGFVQCCQDIDLIGLYIWKLPCSSLVGNIAGKPVQTLVQALSRGGTRALNIPENGPLISAMSMDSAAYESPQGHVTCQK